MTCALIADPAARRSSQSGSSLTTEARLVRIVVVALPRLRRNWLLSSAVLAAWGNIGSDLEGLTRPRFLSSQGFRPGGWLPRHRAGDAAPPRCAAGRMCRWTRVLRHLDPARRAVCP